MYINPFLAGTFFGVIIAGIAFVSLCLYLGGKKK